MSQDKKTNTQHPIPNMTATEIEIYTDGSCNPVTNIGAWGAILFIQDEKIVLNGTQEDTTHNRMELLAVIEAIKFLREKNLGRLPVRIYTDSQYVEKIQDRKQKLVEQHFLTRKGTAVGNADLVQTLINLTAEGNISFGKVKAHQKSGDTPNFNREVDMMVRKLIRGFTR